MIDKELRKQAEDRMRAGEKPHEVAAALNLNASTVTNWYRRQNPEPKGIPPPHDGDKKHKKDKAGTYKASAGSGRRPITEKTAGMLVAGIFTLAAIFDGETWLLNDVEREGMAGSLADSMRNLPSPVADTINTWAAPATFFSALAAVIRHKISLRNEAKKKPKPTTILAHTPPPVPSSSSNGRTPFVPPAPPPGGPFTQREEPSLAEAIDAARSNLNALDNRDDTESHFQ